MTPENKNNNSHQPGDSFHPTQNTTPQSGGVSHSFAAPVNSPEPASFSSSEHSHSVLPPVQQNPNVSNQPSSNVYHAPESLTQGSHIDTAPDDFNNSTMPAVTQVKKSKKLGLIIGIVAIILLFFGGGAAVAYNYFVIAPKNALASYIKKVATAKTARFEANGSMRPKVEKVDKTSGDASSADLLAGSFSVSASGAYDMSDTKQPKAEVTVSAKSGEIKMLSGSLKSFVDEFYFKLDSFYFLEAAGRSLGDKWYKMKIDQAVSQSGVSDCKLSDDSVGLLSSPILVDLPVKETKLVNYSEKIAGHNTSHYRGEMDFNKMQSYIDGLNNKLPASCKITVRANDFSGMKVVYDLYSSQDFDRLDLSISYDNDKVNLMLDSKDYNKPIAIIKPANAIDIKNFMELFNGQTSSGTTESTALGGQATTAKARDSQRKTDIRNIKTALESYYNDNSSYPSRNNWTTELTSGPPYMKSIPKDPKTGQNYLYSGTPDKPPFTGYTLSATLENESDKDAKNGLYTVANAN